MAVVTCHTQGCQNDGQEIYLELTYVDPDGVVRQVSAVQCGACGQPITDIKR